MTSEIRKFPEQEKTGEQHEVKPQSSPEAKIGENETATASMLEKESSAGYLGRLSSFASTAWERIKSNPQLNYGAGIAHGIYEDVEGALYLANTVRKASGVTFFSETGEHIQHSREELKAMGMSIATMLHDPAETMKRLAQERAQSYTESLKGGGKTLGYEIGKDAYNIGSMVTGKDAIEVALRRARSLSRNKIQAPRVRDRHPDKAKKEMPSVAEKLESPVDRVRSEIESYQGSNIDGMLEGLRNRVDRELLRGSELSMLSARGDVVIMVDANRELQALRVNPDNASQILKQIKEHDTVLRGRSFELRQAILQRSGGSINSFEAYTYNPSGNLTGSELKNFLDEPKNWVPERRRMHEQLITEELRSIEAMSERISVNGKTIYALRGNTAAGKTTMLRQNERFSGALDADGRPTGAVNPDKYKVYLRNLEQSGSKQTVNSTQVHSESTMITRRIKNEIQRRDLSAIYDQRFNENKDIVTLLEDARRTGKNVKILDVDAPLELSIARVFLRKADGPDPVPPFEILAEGFQGIRENRKKLIKEVVSNPDISDYTLYAYDQKGQARPIYEKVNGVVRVIDRSALRDTLLSDPREIIERARREIITDIYLEKLRTEYGATDDVLTAMERYKGQSLEQALERHSRNAESGLDLPDYISAAERNLHLTSRTARGKVDTSASADKAEKMMDDLNPEQAADRATGNFREALEIIFRNKDMKLTSPQELRTFVESIAKLVNKGITKENILIRSGVDSTKFPYTKVAELEGAMNQFYTELFEKINDPKADPVEMAAWIEYRVDLVDHFFADGCGKTAKLVSSWVLMRSGRELPDYSRSGKIKPEQVRDVYYSNAPIAKGRTEQVAKEAQYKKWVEYYKTLFNK